MRNMPRDIGACLLLTMALTACQKGDDAGSVSYQGTWKYSSANCSGTDVPVSGVTEYLTLASGTGTDLTYGSSCYQTTSNLSVSQSGNTLTVTGQAASCSPASCTIPYSSTVGGTTRTASYACPSSWGTSTFTVNGDQLSEDSGSCTVIYQKTTETPPSVPCLSSVFTAATKTGSVGINGGGDKAAEQFQVSSAQTLVAVQVMMTSDQISTATLKLYSGGTNPDNGTLLATVNKTDALGWTTSNLHVFQLSPSVNLSPGTTYYLVFSGTGTSYMIDLNSSHVITGGSSWTWNGTTWSANATYDMTAGFIFSATGC